MSAVRENERAPEVIAVVSVPKLLSIATVADVLGCSPRTVRRRIADGELEARLDHGRIVVRGDELRAYIDRLERVGGRNRRSRAPRARAYDFLRSDRNSLDSAGREE